MTVFFVILAVAIVAVNSAPLSIAQAPNYIKSAPKVFQQFRPQVLDNEQITEIQEDAALKELFPTRIDDVEVLEDEMRKARVWLPRRESNRNGDSSEPSVGSPNIPQPMASTFGGYGGAVAALGKREAAARNSGVYEPSVGSPNIPAQRKSANYGGAIFGKREGPPGLNQPARAKRDALAFRGNYGGAIFPGFRNAPSQAGNKVAVQPAVNPGPIPDLPAGGDDGKARSKLRKSGARAPVQE